jgi:uracil-DNA glycosylase family 4
MLAKYPKPAACDSCSLREIGSGYAPADGSASAALKFYGEALGYNEAIQGAPFIGAAGGMFGRILRRANLERSHIRVDNTIRCQPPGDWLDGAPWEASAIDHCQRAHGRPSIEQWLSTPSHGEKVLVPLGGIALRTILGLTGYKGVSVRDFHGTVHRDPTDRFWVVPTFHPSFLQRGATNLLDVARFDVSVAQRVSRESHRPRAVSLLLDPPLALVEAWVARFVAAVTRDPDGVWLAVDIETPDKAGGRDEGELTNEDRSYTITRVNLSCNPDEGLTVPYVGPFIALIHRAIAAARRILLWNYDYDLPRLIYNKAIDPATYRGGGVPTQLWDLMWAWKKLQSDLPRGLGFVAPFYSDYGAWKHLAKIAGRDVEYAAVDGFQTLRIGYGIVRDLTSSGLWDSFDRHVRQLDLYALKPAEEVGIPIDTQRLGVFKGELETAATAKLALMKEAAGRGSLRPKQGYAKRPAGKDGGEPVPPASITGKTKKKGRSVKSDYIEGAIQLVERRISVDTRCCQRCGKQAVGPKHNCVPKADRETAPPPTFEMLPLWTTRWFWQLPFNPDAPKQVLDYILAQGHTPGKAKKTRKDTTNAETLRKLSKSTGDPLYKHILDYRAVGKVLGTYVIGVERRLGPDGRVHPTFTHKPSTHRLSCVDPNVQNVITDRGGPASLAAGFRRCVVAGPGCRLLEVDYSGIEAVETGWWSGDPNVIRLAKLGIHAYLASHLAKAPADLAWSDDDLRRYFAEIKKKYEKTLYDKAKRCVHGNNYGLTVHGMHTNFPDVYPTLGDAKEVQELLYSICPALPAFHRHVREKAHRQGYLGGPGDHPYGYRHWFWSVLAYKPINPAKAFKLQKEQRPVAIINGRPFEVVLGEDSKRVIAFYPQSTSAGVLKDAMLLLFHPDSPLYIGDAYYGRTPLRAPVHDSLLLEVPEADIEWVLERVLLAMRRPIVEQPCPAEWNIGPYLTIGVEAKIGRDWLDMEKITLTDAVGDAPAAASVHETMYLPPEEDEQEDDFDLGTVLGEKVA